MAYLSLFLYVTALLLWSPKLATVSLATNHTDHLALLAIKSSIIHDPQHFLDSWNTSFHFCQWQGVTCGRRHPRVTRLDLGSRGFAGSMSPHIGNLSFLRVIDLGNNTFKGVIPPQLGNLFRLQELYLGNNSFKGEVPTSLSNCTRLNLLWLGGNNLVGKLPQELSALVNLMVLVIHDNGFTGRILSFFGNFTSLITLLATNNDLGGSIPHTLGQLYNLQAIGLGANHLYGTIPQSLCNLTSLKILSIPDNSITGSLPKYIGLQLPNLKVFYMWSNKFTGSIPFSFSNCSNLFHLDLGENSLTGKVNIDFRRIPNLWKVRLSGNSLGSSEPDEMNFIDSMVNCSKLEGIYLLNNLLTGVLPSSIGNLSSQLRGLSFKGNFIYGTLPSRIGNLLKLEELYISSNQFTGIVPSQLGNLQNLKYLYMNDNLFTGKFPKFIGNMSLLELVLGENRLEGHIPPNLGNCRGLLTLDLSVNNLTGPIPVELFQVSSLSIYLDLSHNHLVGPLPQEIGKLKSLSGLDLSHNDLVGAIPKAITSCISLEYLNLGANSFQGPIPPSMSVLRGITNLNLSSNNFSGQIPKFLEQLNLSSLDLSFNNLYGEVPLEGILKNASLISIQGNNRLCGGLLELRLPKCAIVSRSKRGSRTLRVILIVIPIFSLLVVAMVLLYLYYWKRRKAQAQPATTASYVQLFSRVSYGSILKATNDFSQQNLIGTGAFSAVYKGILQPADGMVAIKVLKLANQGALKSFMMECEALKNIRHRNLVKVITSCSSVDFQGNDFKALIYEFMPNGNLERWLHPSSEQEVDIGEAPPQRLTLHQRVKIATYVAHAMHYLHQECEVPIIHCDLKPGNILLDSDMVAHIGDFGLAKFLPLKPQESSSVGLRGTIGYAPPEYGLGGEMTKEGDIYSFGILLLEMTTGKRPTDCIFQEGLNLHGYVTMALPDRLMEIIEPTLLSINVETREGAHVNHENDARKWEMLEKSMILLARIGLACSLESPKERMNTSEIIQELHHINGLLEGREYRRVCHRVCRTRSETPSPPLGYEQIGL